MACQPGANSVDLVLPAGGAAENARLRITASADPLVSGTSAAFALGGITIVSPRGGGLTERDRWQIGTDQVVRWTAAGAGDSVDIAYSVDSGAILE